MVQVTVAVPSLAVVADNPEMVAAVVTFFCLLVLFSCGLLENLVNGESAKKVLGQMNLWQHMDDFSKGIVDTRRLVYYATGVSFFLFLTSRALAAKKWR